MKDIKRAMADLLLGLDIGTQSVKGVLVDRGGTVLVRAQVEHQSSSPGPGLCEQDMAQNWWENPAAVIRRLLAEGRVDPTRVGAVGISGLYPALGPTDAAGTPLRPAILYSDNRAIAEIDEINRALGLELTSEELTPKLVWFLRNEPELAGRMRKFFDAAHYLVYKLTGAYVTDTITSGLTGAIYASPSAGWREDVCRRFNIPVDILPKVRPPAEIAGRVHREASELTSLAPGTPVLSGMPDLFASVVSAGVTSTTETIAYYGTAGLVPVLNQAPLEAAFRPHPEEDGYMFVYPSYSLAVGDGLRWFRDVFGRQEVQEAADDPSLSAYERLDRLAAGVPPGCEGLVFLPYLFGQRSPWFDPSATGVLFGLTRSHGRAHVYRAIMEAFGYTIRHGLDTFYPEGLRLDRMVATGGGARSPLWRQIVSDITGLNQAYVAEADGPMGCAYIAGLALGWFKDFGPLQESWVQVSAEVTPHAANREAYAATYVLYRDLHPALRPLFERHQSLRRPEAHDGS
jgi:xylulokinase